MEGALARIPGQQKQQSYFPQQHPSQTTVPPPQELAIPAGFRLEKLEHFDSVLLAIYRKTRHVESSKSKGASAGQSGWKDAGRSISQGKQYSSLARQDRAYYQGYPSFPLYHVNEWESCVQQT